MTARNRRQRRLRRARSRKSKKPLLIALLIAVVAVIVVVWFSMVGFGGSDAGSVVLRTSRGDIVIELYDDMPITAGNFKGLVQQGVYNGTIFHRVIDGFMIQGGDPTGTGFGDPSIPSIPDEFSANSDHNRNDRGTIAMANTGEPDTGSSQFFINLVDNNRLDLKHPVFGRVVEGMDVVDAIGKVETDGNDRPIQEVRIIEAELLD